MGAAKQRRAAKEWVRRMDILHEDAAGCHLSILITPERVIPIQRAAANGDEVVETILHCLTHAIRDPVWLTGKSLCLNCDHELHQVPNGLGLSMPNKDEPKMALAIGICDECLVLGTDKLEQVFYRRLRELLPDMQWRPYQQHIPGHA